MAPSHFCRNRQIDPPTGVFPKLAGTCGASCASEGLWPASLTTESSGRTDGEMGVFLTGYGSIAGLSAQTVDSTGAAASAGAV